MEATTQTLPPRLFSLSSFPPPHLFIPLTHHPPPRPPLVTLYPPPPLPHHALSFSFSVLPGYRRVKGMLRTPQQTLDSFYRRKINVHALQRGGRGGGAWEKTLKKSCNNETRIPWREYEKRYCLKQLLYSRFHNERVLFQQSAVDQGESFKWFKWKKPAP